MSRGLDIRTELEISVPSDGLLLAGTLTLPAGRGPYPGAVIVAGSGRLDRDANRRGARLGVSRDLAGALADRGVASLRYDKRGVGASEGSYLTAGFNDNVVDAKAAVSWLHACAAVCPRSTFLVGHSEGAYIASQLGEGPVARYLSGVVLLAPPARCGQETLAWQMRQVSESLPRRVLLMLRMLWIDPVTRHARLVARIGSSKGDVVRMGVRRVNARWFREILAFDPRPGLARLQIPVLAIAGGKDLQVPPSDLAIIAETVPGPVQTVLVPDLTHLLRRDAGEPSVTAYRKLLRAPTDPEVLATVCAWIVRHSES